MRTGDAPSRRLFPPPGTPSMAKPSAFEQLTLELINQARLNPHGEYARWVTNGPANVKSALDFFNVDLVLLKQQFNALTPVAPVAWNLKLGDSAQTHTNLMAEQDEQSHDLEGEPSLGQRFINAGYKNFTSISENIFAFAQDAQHAHAAFMIDWGNTPTGIQNPPGHRNAIMNATFTEAGIGRAADSNPATEVGPNLVTHHFGNRSGYTSQITGVIFNDADGDRFYDIGEGKGGTTISAATGSTTNWSSGGYNLDLAAGTHTLTFSGPLGTAKIKVKLGAENIKVDMFDPGSFASSVSATLGSGGVALKLLGEKAISATGNSSANLLIGNMGNNTLKGAAGNDKLYGGSGNDKLFGESGNDTLKGGDGKDILNGGAGKDTLTGGKHADAFRFTTALGASNVDTITDFTVNVDRIQIDDAIFTAVGSSLTADEFVANASGNAANALQHILYSKNSGKLFYDADGNGGQAKVYFATLSAGLALDHLDFLVI
jgi:Ca2+-binding RTX toxin-like protein